MAAKHGTIERNPSIASLLLRIGLAAVFLYAAISSFTQPDAWVSYVPSLATKVVSAKTALDGIAVLQIALSLLLLSGKYLKYAAIVSAALLGGIVVANLGTLLITFRDVGLFFMALALVFLD
jgi:uncharacterized membrane protein YphA (DoxX/SURF4 family)